MEAVLKTQLAGALLIMLTMATLLGCRKEFAVQRTIPNILRQM